MAFSERFLDELLSRSDIVDVVSGYVQLTKRSGSNMFGLCPFHSEKTPSFSVSQDKQIYHCFGCGKGGSAINFIMEMENLSFLDAVEFLAKRAGMQVPDDSPEEFQGKRTRMLQLNKDAARFFFDNLKTSDGKKALEYISNRRISKEMVIRFGLGAVPDSWNSLYDAMRKKGYTPEEMLDAGLIKRGKNGGFYDTFRNRLMFPVIDVRGSVIGFSGRILDDGEPKYLNSPDTVVFKKSKNLFGLNLAKKSKMGMIILVEGNIDVVSLHQAGIDCAVASLGTSLTPDQARLISRYTDNVVICYDSDGAGVKAAQRAISILEKTGLTVKVLQVSGAKDPDEFIMEKGPDAFKLLLERSENHIEYRIMAIRQKYDLELNEGRLGFLSEATELLSALPSAIEREIYGGRVAELAGVTHDAVAGEVKKAYRKRVKSERSKFERNSVRPTMTAQPADRSLRYDNVNSATAEEGVIRLLLLDPSLVGKTTDLSKEEFTSNFLSKAYEEIKKRLTNGDSVSIPLLSEYLSAEEISQLTSIVQKPEAMGNYDQAMSDYINKIKTEKLKKDLNAVAKRYRETKGYGDK